MNNDINIINNINNINNNNYYYMQINYTARLPFHAGKRVHKINSYVKAGDFTPICYKQMN